MRKLFLYLFLFIQFIARAQSVSPAPMISGSTDNSKWFQIGSDIKNMKFNFGTSSQISSSTVAGYYYKLIVRGTFGTNAASTALYMDAAYYNSNIANSIGIDSPVLNSSCIEATWKLMGACPPKPNFPVGYASDNIYEYYIGLWAGGSKYSFTDGDTNNNGTLKFELWENKGTEAICAGSSTTLSSNLGGTISWYKNDVLIPAATSQTLSVNEAGVYTAKSTIAGILSAASNPITVVVNPLPTITLGAVPAITSNNRSFTIPYSSPTNSPSRFSVTAINMNGFQPISNGDMGGSTLTVNIPFGQIGSYDFSVNVKNTTTGCVSNNYTATVQINLAAPEFLSYNTPVKLIVDQQNLVPIASAVGYFETFRIISGTLPPGMSIDQYTGDIYGRPTILNSSPVSVVVEGRNSQGTTNATVVFTVVIPPPSGFNFPTNSYTFQQYTQITPILPAATGAGISFAMAPGSTLPSGLSLNPTNGEISGTPLVPSPTTRYTIRITVQERNSSNFTDSPIDITVIIAPPDFTYSVPNRLFTGSPITPITPLKASTGGVVGTYTTTTPLPPGLSLDPNTGTISGTPTQPTSANTYVIKGSNSNGDLIRAITFEVVIPAPSNLRYQDPITFYLNTPFAPIPPTSITGTVSSYTISPTLPGALSIDPATGVLGGFPSVLSPPIIYTITAANSTSDVIFTTSIRVVIPPPSGFSYSSPPELTQGVPMAGLMPQITGTGITFTAPSLPDGLAINPTTGEISGTPTTASPSTVYIIRASNSTDFVSAPIIIGVRIAAPSALTYPRTLVFEERVPISPINPGFNGIVDNFEINPTLPAGINLNSGNGQIHGTPSIASPSATYTITARNTTGFTTSITNITVLIAKPQIYYTTPNVFYETVAIAPLSPNKYGTTVNSFTISPTLPPGLNFDTSTGIISGASTRQIQRTTFTITGTNSTGEGSTAVDITVTIPPPSNLRYITPPAFITGIVISTLTPTVSETVDLYSIDKTLPNGLNFNTRTGAISGTPTQVIPRTIFTITASNVAGSTYYELPISVLIPAPSELSYISPHVYEEEVPITPLNPSVTGKVDTYTIDKALPDGLTLNPITGVISGTPTKAIPLTEYWVTATNTTGSARARLVITVLIARPHITYPEPILGAQINPVYTGVDLFFPGKTNADLIPVIKGVVGSIAISRPLPSGLVFNPTNGVISGTPTVLSPPTTYVVTITNSTASTTDTIRIATVIPNPSSLSYVSPQTYTEKIKITPLIPSVQGNPTLFTIDKPLPAGLTFNATTGTIIGTPTKAQDYTDYLITASNSTGFDQFTLSIKVLIAFPEIDYPTTGVFKQGVAVSFKPVVVGIVDVFSIDSLLPPGLNLDPKTGLISGIPTWPAKPRTYIITARNSTGPGRDSTTITVLEDVNYDTDKDGYTDIVEIGGDRNNPVDTDKDGLPDYNDLDSDGDEIKDEWENDLNYGGLPDCDHDGVDNRIDPDACDPVAFQGISPNGDGKNDYLVIPGVMRTTPNTLTVLDRGGNIVFEAKDYGNNWGGETNRGNPLLAGDGLLPDGVYFYILDYNGVRPRVSTYIYINRLKK
ncbi:MAG: putative Ig domain-containing protein [Aquirufa sp.]